MNKRNVVFYIATYKGNRIAIKLMSLLKESSDFTVEALESLDENRIFEISIFTDMDFKDVVLYLKEVFVLYLDTHFPDNYLFDFKDRRLGFINSFNVFSGEGFHFEVCHKIKEVRTNGGTNIPTQKITI